MVIPLPQSGVLRVTVALDPIDVDLLDRLAALEGKNRSAELRGLLAQVRPVLRQTVEAFEAALRAREQFDQAAASATVSELEALTPQIEQLQGQFLGMMARLEGAQAAAEAALDREPPSSNHGGYTPLNEPGEE